MTATQDYLLAKEPRPVLAENIRLREIPSLSGLRAFASMTVVLCHVVSPFVAGRYAVTLFFVLSGFLITILLRREMASTGTISIRAFYLRRSATSSCRLTTYGSRQ